MKEPLILSYSYSGHTHRIAQMICALTGGSWCEIYPRQPYPMAFPELLDQVRREVQTGYHPRLLPGASSPKPYAVVFVGSPNWCGHIAPPLAAWLAKNDLAARLCCRFIPTAAACPAILPGRSAACAQGRRSVSPWGFWRIWVFWEMTARPCGSSFGSGWEETDCRSSPRHMWAKPHCTGG